MNKGAQKQNGHYGCHGRTVSGAPMSALLGFIVQNQSKPEEFLGEYRGKFAWGPRSCARYFKTESEALEFAERFGGQVLKKNFVMPDDLFS
jgi:hypothetical protein